MRPRAANLFWSLLLIQISMFYEAPHKKTVILIFMTLFS